jgi:hypothetical protein
MDELLTRVWENLIGRAHGPLTFRLLLQPAIAIYFATRAGLRDAREDRAPYFWALIYDPAHRREMLRQGWRDVGKIFVIAVVLDVIYQLLVVRWIYTGETLIVATVLALIPYLLIRGLVTRIARLALRKSARLQPKQTSGTQP